MHMNYDSKGGYWNMIILAVWMFFGGKFVTLPRAVCSLLPSIVLYSTIAIIYAQSGGKH